MTDNGHMRMSSRDRCIGRLLLIERCPMITKPKRTFIVISGVCMSFIVRGDEEGQRLFEGFEQAMLQQIEHIHANCKENDVLEAERIRGRYFTMVATTTNASMARRISTQMHKEGRMLALNLKLLQAVINARDPAYDIRHPPHMPLKVSPPPVNGIPSFPGVDPESITDSVARERYIRDIEENRQRVLKHEREKTIDRMRNDLILVLKRDFNTMKSLNPVKLPYAVSLLDSAIDDKEVKQAIMGGGIEQESSTNNPSVSPFQPLRR